MAEPRRDRWGRYIIPDPETDEDREWTRATTLAGVLADRYNLENWGKRMVAFGLAKRPDLLALVQSTKSQDDFGDKRRVDKVCRDAISAAGGGEAANLGTALHSFTEQVDEGMPLSEVPQLYRADVKAYRDKLDEAGIEVLSSETIVVNPAVGVAGTYDRLFRVPGLELPVIGDIKTGKSAHKFGQLEHSVQFAIYANATHVFEPETETLTPAPEIWKALGILVHLPVGQATCDLYAIDLEEGWKNALLARATYDARKNESNLSRPFETAGKE